MRKIVVTEFISLDGVVQAPGGEDEDTDGGFQHGGWTFPLSDEFSGEVISGEMKGPFDLLLGRKTYDIFSSYWPNQEGEIAEALNEGCKYVVSCNSIDLPWEGSVLINEDVVSKLKALKEEDGPRLQVYGSSKLMQTLLKNDLVDEFWLKVFPVTLGNGKRLFEEGTIPAAFELKESKVSPSGVIFATYVRTGDVKTGSFV